MIAQGDPYCKDTWGAAHPGLRITTTPTSHPQELTFELGPKQEVFAREGGDRQFARQGRACQDMGVKGQLGMAGGWGCG